MRCLPSRTHALAAGISLACAAFANAHAASIELGSGDQMSLKKLNVSTSDEYEPVLLVNGATAQARITDSTFATSGQGSNTVQVLAGYADLQGTTLSTSGGNASAIAADGKDSRATLTDGILRTQGQNAHGATVRNEAHVQLNNVEIVTDGAGSRGLNANGASTLGVLLGRISTSGRAADGVYLRGVSDQQRANATLLDSMIHTFGDSAKAINVNRDSQVSIQRSSLLTQGQAAHGIWAASDTSLVLADDVQIATFGVNAIGAMAQSGATINLNHASIETFADSAHGLYADAASKITAKGVDIKTHGISGGVFAAGTDAWIGLENAVINSRGGGVGVIAYGKSRVEATGLDINAEGEGARGLLLQDGAGMSLLDARVQVSGLDSAGVRSLTRSGQINGLQMLNSQIVAQPTAIDVSGGLRLELLNSHIAGERLLHSTARVMADGSRIDDEMVSIAALSSSLSGDILVEAQQVGVTLRERSGLHGAITGLQQLSLDNSIWLMTANSDVRTLDLQEGHVVFDSSLSDAFKTLTINQDLNGSGRFDMRTDLSTLQGDLIRVNGNIDGSHTLVIEESGRDPSGPGQKLRVVDGQGGKGSFVLSGGHVDAGAFRYTLEQQGDDWFLLNGSSVKPPVDPSLESQDPEDSSQDIKPPVSPPPPPAASLSKGANAAIAAQTSAATLWSAQMNALVKRLGELRMGHDDGGIWTRAIGKRFDVSEGSSRAYTQNVTGMEVGADKAFAFGNSKLYVGGVVGSARSTMNFGEGASGEVQSRLLGSYATYLHESGVYLDTVLKYSHFDNEIKTPTNLGRAVKGSYTNRGFGADIEAGRHLELEKGWFVEPQVEVTANHTTVGNYTATNGLRVEAGAMKSLQSRVGTLLGRNMKLDGNIEIQPYAKASWITEHAGDSTVKVNGNRLKARLPGDRLEFGAGSIVKLSERSKVAIDAEFSKGRDIKQPWGITLGYRYIW